MIKWDQTKPSLWTKGKFGVWVMVCDFCGHWTLDVNDKSWYEVKLPHPSYAHKKTNYCPHCASRQTLESLVNRGNLKAIT